MFTDSHFGWLEILLRLLAALGAGAALGIDREWLHKPAGLKTHMLFALASAAMSIMAIDIYLMELDRGPGSNPDATRVLQGIITGMSFLGAGAIIRGQHKVHGLTTGASVWLAGALGIVFGVGLYRLGTVALLLGLLTLVLIRMIEPRHDNEDAKKAQLAALATMIDPHPDK
ncbi:MAG TPA: MgtC/SapB family protein [Alphaproteobacteria bacterium]|jgi:putative Mg2+ transporter-C (MgtC) family protein|nr:MgtC/SapB family protein [Alphaproteobacteria bacterium]